VGVGPSPWSSVIFAATSGWAPSSTVARTTAGASGRQPESGCCKRGCPCYCSFILKKFENVFATTILCFCLIHDVKMNL
jgi:hypothetical protein